MTPESAAGPPLSAKMMWLSRVQITSSPGRGGCTAIAISLHMGPKARKSAASIPSISATRAQSSDVDGSGHGRSSPSGISRAASRIARVRSGLCVRIELVHRPCHLVPPGR